ncbi:hypothetical protein ACJU26_09760 [Acidithiobacillus sp. M4-SHS-6]|uniref:hypothetical protein n=1 Tax=Acidithiobacillus sp. M4-SHS-6 TaxID=3383024 RepID=UPI0039BEB60E
MNQIIAIDSDQVLVDFVSGWAHFASTVLGREIHSLNTAFPLHIRFGLTGSESNRVWTAFNCPEAWGNLPFYTGAAEAVRELLDNGYAVHVVTSVPTLALDARRQAFNRTFPGIVVHQAESLHTNHPNDAPSKETILKTLKPAFYADDRWPHIREAINAGVPHIYRISGAHDGDGKPVSGITVYESLEIALKVSGFL